MIEEKQMRNHLEPHIAKIPELIPLCTDKEQTRKYLINPYLDLIGWNTQDSSIVRLKYPTRSKNRYNKEVDYALYCKEQKEPIMIIESQTLDREPRFYITQDLRYQFTEYTQRDEPFHKKIRYAILTNGLIWQFYGKHRYDPGSPALEPKWTLDVQNANKTDLANLWLIHPDRILGIFTS